MLSCTIHDYIPCYSMDEYWYDRVIRRRSRISNNISKRQKKKKKKVYVLMITYKTRSIHEYYWILTVQEFLGHSKSDQKPAHEPDELVWSN